MTKRELLDKLAEYDKDIDKESGHYDADHALLDYIDDPDIIVAYEKLTRWYA